MTPRKEWESQHFNIASLSVQCGAANDFFIKKYQTILIDRDHVKNNDANAACLWMCAILIVDARRGSVVSADGSLEADNQVIHSEVDGQHIEPYWACTKNASK